MAYVKKSGSRFCVHQGNNGAKLSCFSKEKDAKDEVRQLHKQHQPENKNRGGSAKKRNE